MMDFNPFMGKWVHIDFAHTHLIGILDTREGNWCIVTEANVTYFNHNYVLTFQVIREVA